MFGNRSFHTKHFHSNCSQLGLSLDTLNYNIDVGEVEENHIQSGSPALCIVDLTITLPCKSHSISGTRLSVTCIQYSDSQCRKHRSEPSLPPFVVYLVHHYSFRKDALNTCKPQKLPFIYSRSPLAFSRRSWCPSAWVLWNYSGISPECTGPC